MLFDTLNGAAVISAQQLLCAFLMSMASASSRGSQAFLSVGNACRGNGNGTRAKQFTSADLPAKRCR